MIRFHSAAALALTVGVLAAMGTAAEPPRPPASVPLRADGALDSSPAPVRTEPTERAREAPALPAPAQSGTWRNGARPPGDVPPGAVVRAALRSPGPRKARADRKAIEPPRAIEIVWNAPGS